LDKNFRFINKAIKIHDKRYDYSLVEYKSNKAKVKIICPIHGVFEQAPTNHLRGQGCAGCTSNKKLTVESLIEQCVGLYGDKYSYEEISYINSKTKVKVRCNVHDIIFEKTPQYLLKGKGCPKCANRVIDRTTFIDKSILIHDNKYGYNNSCYISAHTPLLIECKRHGTFEQTPNNHLCGQGCPKCSGKFKNNDDYINDFIEVHGNYYDYSLFDYVGYCNKTNIICPKHGIFKISAVNHLKGQGCAKCSFSKGEDKISKFLDKNNIIYTTQKTYNKLKSINGGRCLRFDFYLPEFNLCIEYDGIQHYQYTPRFHKNIECFYKLQLNDLLKTDYCVKNKIDLIRIGYKKFDDIEYILSTYLKIN
jgi:hypothetical protein